MTRPVTRLSLAEARRVALAAQGLSRPRPARPVAMRDVQAAIGRLGQFQIDSVNVVTRAHHVPLYSRLGPYDLGLLGRAAGHAPRRLFEYWGHEASLIDVTLQPALRWRMAAAAHDAWGRMRQISVEQPDLIQLVRAEIADRGPMTARELARAIAHDEDRLHQHWGWNWSSVKTSLEWLFWCGEVTAARRNIQFERVYDLPERVVPPAVLAVPTPPEPDAIRTLVAHAARALGVAGELELRDYFRLPVAPARQAVAELVEAGQLVPVTVRGWDARPTYLWHDAVLPRTARGRALLCPFDSMIFERARLAALFGFRYRIEIYVPAGRRVHGYYVYPFLLRDRFVARVDLKADRTAGMLRVRSAWLEPLAAAGVGEVVAELAAELALMADWLGLSDVTVEPAGDLALALNRAVAVVA